MPKGYSDRQMKKDAPKEGKAPKRTYFFPKANPPKTIEAKSREEAEKLADKSNK